MTAHISDRWPNFSEDELACKGDGTLSMNCAFMDRLQALRDAYGKPMIVTSGYRSPEYNATISKTGTDGPHTTGRAVDIAIRGREAYVLLSLAIELGFTGIGVSQKGEARFLHLDDLTAEEGFPRPWIWSY